MAQNNTFGWYPSEGATYSLKAPSYARSDVRVDKISHKHKTVHVTLLFTALGEVATCMTFDQAAELVWEVGTF